MVNQYYTVLARRWGWQETHSYLVGVFSRADLALQAAESEESYRGGKYSCEIMEWEVDCELDREGYQSRMVKKAESR